jgi:hypothetical protein
MPKSLADIREQQEIARLMEKLTAADPTGKWISDFVKSDDPKFAGKSKKERINMALGASYAAQRNEDIEIEEAAWGQDKMSNLRAAHDRHSEKAMAANRAGDHEAVKVHQSKMNMIKTQMNKLRKEEVEQVDELRTSTLMRYNTKAHASANKLTGQASQAMDNDDRETANKLLNKRDNREVGIDRSRAKIQKNIANKNRVSEDIDLDEAMFEIGHAHNKTTKMSYSQIQAKNPKDAIAKSHGKADHEVVHVYNMDKETFHHPQTGRKMSDQYNEAWTQGNRNPQKGIKVGHKVRSYDFPGMHDDHYIEGHVIGEGPHSYQIKVNRVVRGGKEVPVPAHMQHVEAPKGRGMFSQAYAVHKILDKQNSVAAAPEVASGAARTFSSIRGRQ